MEERLERLVGQVLDNRYQLHAVVGVGGSAVVFDAQDLLLRRRVALKMLRSTAAPAGEGMTVSEAEREARNEEARRINRSAFLREADTASVLSHPNIVGVFDVLPETDNPYIVMEYVEGMPLSDRIAQKGCLAVREILRVTHGVLEALCEAHEHGIVHRDIKAQNILLTPSGGVKVADFGIAKTPWRDKLNLHGRVLGTVDTISPEQASGSRVDARSDLYSLGVVMYHMATGVLPFQGDDETVAFMQVNEAPKYPSTLNPAIPAGLEQIILTAMEKSPDKRFPTAADMLAAVRVLEKNPHHVFRRFRTVPLPSPARFFARHGVVFFVALGVALAALCVYAAILFTNITPLPSVTVVELPTYTGTLYTGNALDLDPRITLSVRYEYRPDLPEGTVLAQSPAAGTRLKLDGDTDMEQLTLTVSTQDPNKQTETDEQYARR
ncbi:MAG: serine/threonine protein kinase [Clostridia bacterium]|nr:serine/threonine protein kinase [Clostridia bacterium]